MGVSADIPIPPNDCMARSHTLWVIFGAAIFIIAISGAAIWNYSLGLFSHFQVMKHQIWLGRD